MEMPPKKKFSVLISGLCDIGFDSLENAKRFALGFNTSVRQRDFEKMEFSCPFYQRGYDFVFKVWTHLKHFEDTICLRKYRAFVQDSHGNTLRAMSRALNRAG